jgi:hypothetical protein
MTSFKLKSVERCGYCINYNEEELSKKELYQNSNKNFIHLNNALSDIPPDYFYFKNEYLKKIEERGLIKLEILQNESIMIKLPLIIDSDGLMSLQPEILNFENENENKNEEFFSIAIISGIHPREWESQKICSNIVKESVHNYSINKKLKDNKIKILVYLFPLINWPGFLTTISPYFEEHIKLPIQINYLNARLNRKFIDYIGIDINRNYPFYFKPGKNESEPIYSGQKPLSEPESKILNDKLMELKEKLTMIIDLHDYGNFVIPFNLAEPPENNKNNNGFPEHLNELTNLLYKHQLKLSKIIFGTERVKLPYHANGILSDHFSNEGIPSFTIEIGNEEEAFKSDGLQGKKNQKQIFFSIFKYIHQNINELKQSKIQIYNLLGF